MGRSQCDFDDRRTAPNSSPENGSLKLTRDDGTVVVQSLPSESGSTVDSVFGEDTYDFTCDLVVVDCEGNETTT